MIIVITFQFSRSIVTGTVLYTNSGTSIVKHEKLKRVEKISTAKTLLSSKKSKFPITLPLCFFAKNWPQTGRILAIYFGKDLTP